MTKTGRDTATMDLRDFFSASQARIDRCTALQLTIPPSAHGAGD
jgi:hypothetical protein